MSLTTTVFAPSRLLVATVFNPFLTPLKYGNFQRLILSKSFNYTNKSQFKYIPPPSRSRDKNKGKRETKKEVLKNSSNVGLTSSIGIPTNSTRDKTIDKKKPTTKLNKSNCDKDTSTILKSKVLDVLGLERSVNKIKTWKRFSQKEDILILSDVNKFGYKNETFKLLCIKLERKSWASLRNRHRFLVQNPETLSKKTSGQPLYRKYTEEEDELIMNYVKKYGACYQAFNLVAKALDRNVSGVRRRFLIIFHKSSSLERSLIHKKEITINRFSKLSDKKRNKWSLDRDEAIIKYVFQVM